MNRTAFNQKIKIARLQPQGQELQVWIDTVPFDDLLIWLATLSDQYGVQVQIIELAREGWPRAGQGQTFAVESFPMKRKIVIASLFLLAYLGFLLAQLPASLVVRHLPLPPIWCGWRVSGTLWSGQAARVQYASESLTQLRWDLDGWSLLRLAPEVSVRFGERSGLNGQGILGWNGAAFGRDITLNAPAPGCWSGCR